jgi:hypothetical protein
MRSTQPLHASKSRRAWQVSWVQLHIVFWFFVMLFLLRQLWTHAVVEQERRTKAPLFDGLGQEPWVYSVCSWYIILAGDFPASHVEYTEAQKIVTNPKHSKLGRLALAPCSFLLIYLPHRLVLAPCPFLLIYLPHVCHAFHARAQTQYLKGTYNKHARPLASPLYMTHTHTHIYTHIHTQSQTHLWCSSRPMGTCTAAAFNFSFSRAIAMTRHGLEPYVVRGVESALIKLKMTLHDTN